MNPVVGNVLLVAVAIVLGMVIATGTLALMDGYGTPTADASFEYTQTPTGLEMKAQAIGTEVDVKLNGRTIGTFKETSAGDSLLIPTAPGDRITVVSTDADQSVLINRQVDERNKIGDFIAYYTFDGSGDTLQDHSGNENDGTLENDGAGDGPDWTGNALRFDGSGDYVDVRGISAPGDVDEFTVAVDYRQTGATDGDVNQLLEHSWGSEEWFIETRTDGSGTYRLEYAVGYPDSDGQLSTGYEYDFGDRHVAVGTYDGEDFELYVDGQKAGDGSFDREVNMGDMKIGRDHESQIQYFEGEIYEIRVYYTAFDENEVRDITNAMS